MKRVMLTFGVSACITLLLAVACFPPIERRPALMPEDVVGTWQADYSQFAVPDIVLPLGFSFVKGIETVILESDGTFQQTFSGDTEETTHGVWTLEDGDILHLKGAKVYVYGLQFAERLASGQARASGYDCHGQPIEVSGSDLVLCVRPNPNVPGGATLQHLEVGDPDSPEIVNFYRISQ
ncbi:MAG: hypothetical protein H6647_14460 [Anaerolineales bacterium]|nr:hypothetical protein [Anaerolineales bacterium]